jgi:hypothetical protein
LLTVEVADAIATEVLQPIREYQRKLQKYRQTLIDTLEDERYPFDEVTQNILNEYQVILGLKDEDVEAIARQVLPPVISPQPPAIDPPIASTSVASRPVIRPNKVFEPFTHQSFTVNLGKPQTLLGNLLGQVKQEQQLEMIAIPSGSFWMGSLDGVGYDPERPRHQVTIAPFWISKYPITQAQYQAIVGKNPSYFKGDQRPVENGNMLAVPELKHRFTLVKKFRRNK